MRSPEWERRSRPSGSVRPSSTRPRSTVKLSADEWLDRWRTFRRQSSAEIAEVHFPASDIRPKSITPGKRTRSEPGNRGRKGPKTGSKPPISRSKRPENGAGNGLRRAGDPVKGVGRRSRSHGPLRSREVFAGAPLLADRQEASTRRVSADSEPRSGRGSRVNGLLAGTLILLRYGRRDAIRVPGRPAGLELDEVSGAMNRRTAPWVRPGAFPRAPYDRSGSFRSRDSSRISGFVPPLDSQRASGFVRSDGSWSSSGRDFLGSFHADSRRGPSGSFRRGFRSRSRPGWSSGSFRRGVTLGEGLSRRGVFVRAC